METINFTVFDKDRWIGPSDFVCSPQKYEFDLRPYLKEIDENDYSDISLTGMSTQKQYEWRDYLCSLKMLLFRIR